MHVDGKLNPLFGKFWSTWMQFIGVRIPLQNLFWGLFNLFMMIQLVMFTLHL